MIAQILIQVSIQTHQQKEGEEEGVEVEVEREPVELQVQAHQVMKWELPSPKVLPSLQKHFRPVRREKREDIEIFLLCMRRGLRLRNLRLRSTCKQGVNGLVDTINKLANSIQALASHKNQSPASKSS